MEASAYRNTPRRICLRAPIFVRTHPQNGQSHTSKYVFSADFLARGYRLGRPASEKMWRMICNPEETVCEDVATAIYVNNPDMGGRDEEIGIWKSVVKTTEAYPFDIDTNHLEIYEAPSEDEGTDPEY